jgi:flagellar hook-length control protein FliK
MSAKVSSSMPASAGSTGTSASTKPAPAAGATASAGAEPIGSAAGSRSSPAAASSAGANTGSSIPFSVAMTDAAQAGDQAANAQIRGSQQAPTDKSTDASGGGTKADSKPDARDTSTAESADAGGDAVAATVRDVVTNALPAATQNAASSKITMPDTAGSARTARPAGKPGGGNRMAAKDTSSAVTTDPVALAMLLAMSGMQMSGGTAANGASEDVSGAPIIGSGRRPTMDAGSAATPSTQSARNAPSIALDAADTTITTGVALADASAALSNSTDADSRTGPTSNMTGSPGLPDLVRSFTNDSAQTPTVQATISVPVASGSWPHAVAAQVHWFVSNDVRSATLRLSPEHLGPIEVHIDVQKSQVNVNFSAAHAETRAALEQTVPRLREIFASGGLTLGQTNVQQDPRPGSQSTTTPARAPFAHAQAAEPVAVATVQSLGLVDEYV